MISGNEIKVLDKNSEFYGVPGLRLMENAGKGVADFIKNELKPKNKNILIFCGTGNNGGDGFVASRILAKKYKVKVFLTGKKTEIKTGIARKNFDHLKKTSNIIIHDTSSLKKIDELILESHIIIDSMLGIGIKGELRKPYLSIVRKINSSKNKTIISVDIPTGFKTDNAVKPMFTITFHDKKNGMNEKNSGRIKIVDIKIPKKAMEYVGPGELSVFYPRSKKESHKGDNGRLLVVGGGAYYGAPALSSFAAQRTGIDLVYIVTPKRVARAITSYSPLLIKPVRLAKEMAKLSPNLIVKDSNHEEKIVSEDVKIVEGLIDKAHALLIGPGLGIDIETRKAVEKILRLFVQNKKPIVIDADAIQVVGKKPSVIMNSQIVLTPHMGEFKELTGITLSKNLDDQKKNVEKWAKKLGVTILLKGPTDIVSNGGLTKLNDVHNEAMTVGGTGDVLAGIIGALLSKDVEPFNAARMGVFLNGTAGNAAFKKRSYGLIATDIIDEIPGVLNKYL